jgi:hypothetical protein
MRLYTTGVKMYAVDLHLLNSEERSYHSSETVSIQVSLFVAVNDWEQKLVSHSPFLMITGQDRGSFLI